MAGGTYDDSEGWFVRPTIIESNDPTDRIFTEEYFGPILSVHVYPDGQFRKVMAQMESSSPYALTGSIIAQDRAVIAEAMQALQLRGRQLTSTTSRPVRWWGSSPSGWSGLRHERQGRRPAEPAALDVTTLDQGDLRAADESRLPAHGVSNDRRVCRVVTRRTLRS